MTVYLAWASQPIPVDLVGPWEELRPAGPQLVLVESSDTLSRVYHELKWGLPEDTALIVTPVLARPKLKGLPAGTTTWLRDRVPD